MKYNLWCAMISFSLSITVYKDLLEEEGKPRPKKILEKDNTLESLFMDRLVNEVSKPIGLCLIDTEAALNVTSMDTINRLELAYTKRNIGTVELVGGDQMNTDGVAEDVHLMIGFGIDIDNDRIRKTILGTGFLRSVGAVIEFDARRMSFNKINPNKFYDWIDISDE